MAAGGIAGRRLFRFAPLIAGVLCLSTLVFVAGCSNAVRWTPEYHTVREGETLFSIAQRYGIDKSRLARWNRLGDGSLIYPGQRLRLTGPAPRSGKAASSTASRHPSSGASGSSSSSAPPVRSAAQKVDTWRWPTSGHVVAAFGSSAKTHSGIEIGGRHGQAVEAAAAGEVVYAGSGLKSYGELVIIRHNDTWLSAYGYNETLLVKEGDKVKAGQRIATMGRGPGRKPLLHFEIRRDGKPVDPQKYLPRR